MRCLTKFSQHPRHAQSFHIVHTCGDRLIEIELWGEIETSTTHGQADSQYSAQTSHVIPCRPAHASHPIPSLSALPPVRFVRVAVPLHASALTDMLVLMYSHSQHHLALSQTHSRSHPYAWTSHGTRAYHIQRHTRIHTSTYACLHRTSISCALLSSARLPRHRFEEHDVVIRICRSNASIHGICTHIQQQPHVMTRATRDQRPRDSHSTSDDTAPQLTIEWLQHKVISNTRNHEFRICVVITTPWFVQQLHRHHMTSARVSRALNM